MYVFLLLISCVRLFLLTCLLGTAVGQTCVSPSIPWTFLELGVIDTVAPNVGQLGSVVTLSGQRLLGGGSAVDSVTLAGFAATVTSESNTEIVVTAAASPSALNGNVVIVADTGAEITLPGGWTYLAPATINDVDPAIGQLGTKVTITGTGFFAGGTGVASVTLVGVATTVDSATDTQVIVTAGSISGLTTLGDVIIVADNGVQTIGENLFEHFENGAIAGVQPPVSLCPPSFDL